MTELRELFEEFGGDGDAVFLFSPSSAIYTRCHSDADPVVVAQENTVNAERFIQLPIEFQDLTERLRFGVEGALDHNFITDGGTVLCAAKLFSDDTDCLTRFNISSVKSPSIYDFFAGSQAEQSAIRNTLMLVISLGQSGQKGNPVGALFTIGDAGTVVNRSRSLSYNPFEKSHVHIGDPIVDTMLKEFSRLDGAFIISDAGKIVSAYRYLEPAIEDLDIPKGLGTRHNAAAAITQETDAVTIVLSESDGRVRGFKNGSIIFNIDPELH